MFRITAGDLLVCEGGEVGRAALVTDEPRAPTIIQNALHVVRGKNGSDTRFLLYVLRQAVESNWVKAISNTSTISHFTADKFGEMRVWMPEVASQIAIADYLDRETARLNALIAAQQRLLSLLAEKRRTFIMRAVARGLNPSTPLRDSDVSWLGEIPIHWEIWKIGHLADVGNGSTPARSNESYWADEGIPWLNSGVVRLPEITSANQFVTKLAARRCHLPIVGSGAVLIAITGQGKTRGRASVLSVEATISQHLAFIRLKPYRLRPWFLRWVLVAAYEYLRSISDDAGGTKGALTCEQIANLRVPVPPLNEQDEILCHVTEAVKKMDSFQSTVDRTIATVKERNAAVISDAVAGKLDLGSAT